MYQVGSWNEDGEHRRAEESTEQLSSTVRDGEAVVIRHRNVPVARILPFRHGPDWDQEAQLVASGAMNMPEQEMDWEDFFSTPAGNVETETAIQAVIACSQAKHCAGRYFLQTYPLKAADALQLAAARTWCAGSPQSRTFIAGDARLIEAARQAGFRAVAV